MKERIEEKLEGNIERILGKEELSATDVAILKERLQEIKDDENKEKNNINKQEMINLLSNSMFD